MFYKYMLIKYISPRFILKLINFWPPYLAAGIRVAHVDKNILSVLVKMPLRFYNINYVGSHFGGSLYSMCDPFYMFILMHHLAKDHIVWDQAASIEFLKPGKNTVSALFEISQNTIDEIKNSALQEFSIKPIFTTYIYDENGETIAKVTKTLYIRRKDAKHRFKHNPSHTKENP